MATIGTPLLWGGFIVFIFAMLAIDLGIFHRKAHVVGFREAAIWSFVWFVLAGVFTVGVYVQTGSQHALEFATGYLIEKALAVDNIFVFVLIFSAFRIPDIYQHRVLVWGVIGALIMRAAFIFAGAAFIQRFSWAMPAFGLILVITGLKLFFQKESHPEQNALIRFFQARLPMTDGLRGERFFIIENGKRLATPLFLALIAVEVTDLIFAVDSIPAIFAITTDPFIVFTSNIFAILGLRSLYFLLAGVVAKFRFLKMGLSAVLLFVGMKMLLMSWYHLPILVSLSVIAGILAISIVASLLLPGPAEPTKPGE